MSEEKNGEQEEKFGTYLRKLLGERGWTQAKLARELKVPPQNISDYVVGKSKPRPPVYAKIKQVIRLDEKSIAANRLDSLFLGREDVPPVILEDDSWQPEDEEKFIQILDKAAREPLIFGGMNLQTKLLPDDLWSVSSRKDHVYYDNMEKAQQIRVDWTNSKLPDDFHDTAIQQCENRIIELENLIEHKNKEDAYDDEAVIEADVTRTVLLRLNREGSNPYPRPVSLPRLVETDQGVVMHLYIGEGDFTTQALREKSINIPILREARSKYVFSTLALRVAYVSSFRDREPWVHFHQRDPVNNSTWPDAWDVGAAGYVDPQNHRYTESNKTISPKIACASELIEELALKGHQLPFEDHFHFFGYAQDLPSRHIILLCLCESGYTPDRNRKPPKDERTGKQFVKGYDRCILNPDTIAEYIVSQKRWVPSAILTLILTLEFFGYPKPDIEEAFRKRELYKYVNLSP